MSLVLLSPIVNGDSVPSQSPVGRQNRPVVQAAGRLILSRVQQWLDESESGRDKAAKRLLDALAGWDGLSPELILLQASCYQALGEVGPVQNRLADYLLQRPLNGWVVLDYMQLKMRSYPTDQHRLEYIQQVMDNYRRQPLGQPVRSRLALLAGRNSQADESQYRRWLALSIDLDGSNKSAADQAVAMLDRHPDPPAAGLGWINLLNTDPADPTTMARIAQWAMGHQLYDQGYRFATHGIAMNVMWGRPLDEQFMYLWLLSSLGSGHSSEVLRWCAGARLSGTPLNARVQLVELLACRQVAPQVFARQFSAIDRHLMKLDRSADRAWLRLVLDIGLDQVPTLLQQAGGRDRQAGLSQLRDMYDCRLGRIEAGARTQPAQWSGWGELACARYAMSAGRRSDGVKQYRRLAGRRPDQLVGVVARIELQQAGASVQLSAAQQRVDRMLSEVPLLDASTGRPVRLSVDSAPASLAYGSVPELILSLTNHAVFGSGVGPGYVCRGRVVLVGTAIWSDGDRQTVLWPAVDMATRLQLAPTGQLGQSLYERQDLLAGDGAALWRARPGQTMDLDLTVLLDPVIGPDGRIQPVAGTAYFPLRLQRRAALTEMDRLLNALASASDADEPGLIASVAVALGQGNLSIAQQRRFTDWLQGQVDAPAMIWLLHHLPVDVKPGPALAAVKAKARSMPVVMAFYAGDSQTRVGCLLKAEAVDRSADSGSE